MTPSTERVDALLRAVRAGGREFDRLVVTRNARVMVSVGNGGRTLRLHERFLDAPEEVLRSIGEMYAAGRTRSARAVAARARVRDYLGRTIPAGGPDADPPPTRAPRALSTDAPHLARLRREFDLVNATHFDGSLPAVPISLSGRMKRRNGHFSPVPLEIVISRRLCHHGAPGESEMTLRHEMIHLWQHVNGRKPGHGRDFRDLAAVLGVHPRATRVVRWR